ncbi:MAG TPA: hypothetical protein VNA69_04515 [Thermoanaerobaculia bacterium]|nr:hypothetical protein [Thermoanaerobaculia bacterium]
MKDRTARIEELEAEIRSRGGSTFIDDEFDEGLLESFLKEVLAFEDGPETTIREELAARGHEVPHDLWDLIVRLAEMNIVIEFTDHLDDDALFQHLLAYLDDSVHIPNDPDTVMHVDIAGEDPDLFLRYYADEEDRELWRRQFPDEPIPPRERLPYDRHRFLPTADDLRARRRRFA